MSAEETRSRREGLKLAQLASYDDIITDALVDKVYFWTSIRKNRGRYSASRGIKEEDVTDILRAHVITDEDPTTATKQLLELPGIQKFVQRLSSSEKDHFQRHLRRYVNIYSPDCPFEVSTTNRYTIDTQEAAITARRDIRVGEQIKYLTGIQAPITKAEETTLDLARLDFSIVMSSRKRTPSLFLGPARFANHDCSANARLATIGSNGMTVIAVKDIQLGEEITVTYGENYFGKDNCECLCATCEGLCRNGWAQSDETPGDSSDVQRTVQVNGRGMRRRRSLVESGGESGSSTPHPTSIKNGTSAEPSQTDTHNGLKTELNSSPPKSLHFANTDNVTTSSNQQLNINPITTSKFTPASSSDSGVPQSLSPSAGASPNSNSTAFTSTGSSKNSQNSSSNQRDFSGVQKPLQIPIVAIPEIKDLGLLENPETTVESITAALAETPKTTTFMEIVLREQQMQDNSFATRVETGSREDSDESTTGVTLANTAARGDNADNEEDNDSDEDALRERRKPGDYTLTPLLLSHPFSRWVTCRICLLDFVQENAYQTREACRRCERHLKLYGYTWPKTQKEGKNDREERIDHRSVIGFVDPTEERVIKKGKAAALKNMLVDKLAMTESVASDASDGSPERPARLRKKIVRPKFDEYAIHNDIPRRKPKKIPPPKAAVLTGEILPKKKREGPGQPSDKPSKRLYISLLKSQSGSMRRQNQSTKVKHIGEIIPRTGKPRVRAVRSDKGIPRPERRKLNLEKRTKESEKISISKNKKRDLSQVDGGDDKNAHREKIIRDGASTLDVPNSKRQRFSMYTSSQKQNSRSSRLKPGWTYVPKTDPPPFAAPPSPPPLRGKSRTSLKTTKAPKKKHSYYYEPKVNPAPLAAPPSPPRVGRRSRLAMTDGSMDSPPNESDDEDLGSYVPRRSGRVTKQKHVEDNKPRNSAQNALNHPDKIQAPERPSRSLPKPAPAAYLTSNRATPDTKVQFLDPIIELVQNANMDAEELGNTVNFAELLVKLQADLAGSKEATNPETMNEAMLKDFFETIQGTLATLQLKNYPQPFYKELFSRVVRSMRSPLQNGDSIVASDALKKFQTGIRNIIGNDDPHWKPTMKAIDDMLKRKEATSTHISTYMNSGSVTTAQERSPAVHDNQPRKRRRVVEDISEDEESPDIRDGDEFSHYLSRSVESNKPDDLSVSTIANNINRIAPTDLRYIMNDADTTSSFADFSAYSTSRNDGSAVQFYRQAPLSTPPASRRGRGRPKRMAPPDQPFMSLAPAYSIPPNPYQRAEILPGFQYEPHGYHM